MASRIEEYALIGDCETAALVGLDGSIDWLCTPRFDSDACFAALLGTSDHGRWSIAPATPVIATKRRYRGDTLILETRLETETGAVTLVDFMVPADGRADIVRLVVGERGRVDVRMELAIRFGYGAVVPWVNRNEDGALVAIAGPDRLVLRTSAPLRGEGQTTVSDFTVAAGEVVAFTLTHSGSHLPLPLAFDGAAALLQTEACWNTWSSKAKVEGEWRDAVMRSLITLKALRYAPTGGIVAAATTSLPETLGGARNWDYRFCWLRDATLSLLALMNAGYYEEAAAWRDWLLRAVAGSPDRAQIMYGIAGEHRLTEWTIDWLPGYEGAKPVRVGNGAHGQLQLDVFGELMDALYQAHRGGLPANKEAWALQRALLNHLAKIWTEPDRGIWESRGEARHYTFSKVMAWVAFDRGVKLAEAGKLDGPVDAWRATAALIHADVCKNGYDATLGSFVQSYGDTKLDASLLIVPTTGFLPVDDPRILGTVKAIEGRMLSNGFVMRHDPSEVETGLRHGEGSFLACSFWLADAYMLLGRHEEARALFERLLALRNDVGLLAEEYDVKTERQVGNFPQAFSHIALITTAHNLGRADKPAEQRCARGTDIPR
jgi:GH15 family glucan-1,4-alpha-glucosidase